MNKLLPKAVKKKVLVIEQEHTKTVWKTVSIHNDIGF